MPVYVIDLEAVPFEPIFSAWKTKNSDKEFPPPFALKIASLGYAKLTDTFQIEKLGVACVNESEREGLSYFSQAIQANKATLVTWNGRNFDLPLISYRCLHHGVAMEWYHDDKSDYKNRYKSNKHFDLQDFISDFGQNRPSLDYIAKLIGLPGKMDAKGSDVEQMWNEGKVSDIVAYNTTDVLQEYIAMLRILLLRAYMNKAEFLALIQDAVQKIKSEGALDMSTTNPNRTVLGNDIEKPATLAIAKGCRTLMANWDVGKTCDV